MLVRYLAYSFFAVIAIAHSYVYSPLAPNALYQEGMNVSFVSGQLKSFAEQAGFGSNGIYNGAFGLIFEKSEKYAFVGSADGKKIRKLNFRTTQVVLDITAGK